MINTYLLSTIIVAVGMIIFFFLATRKQKTIRDKQKALEGKEEYKEEIEKLTTRDYSANTTISAIGNMNYMRPIGAMVGLLIGLYVFDSILSVVVPIACEVGPESVAYNVSTTSFGPNSPFCPGISMIWTLVPVAGIIGMANIVIGALRTK